MHYRLGFRQGWILPCMDQIGNIWCGSLEKITMVAVSRAGMRIRGARRSCRAFTRSASSEEACRSAANAHARHAATGGVSHRAPRGEPWALASALRLPVRRADVFFSPFAWKGGARNRLRPLCFPGQSPSAWESGFRAISRIARVAALPSRCPHRPRFLTDKKSKIRTCANGCVPLLYLLATRTWLSW